MQKASLSLEILETAECAGAGKRRPVEKKGRGEEEAEKLGLMFSIANKCPEEVGGESVRSRARVVRAYKSEILAKGNKIE